MKRPVLYILGFLIFGIILGVYASFPIFALGTALGLLLCAGLYRHYRYKPVFIFVLFLLLGLWRVGHSLHSYATEPTYVQLSGIAQDIGITSGGNQRVIIRTESGLRVMAYIPVHLPWAELGQEITVAGELRPLVGRRNPGGYNQFQHLRAQKVDATIWPHSVTLDGIRLSPTVILRMFRDRLANVYDQLLPPREAAIIKSMILGDRADMDWDLADQYRTMGIFHILSISGLHVAILMMALNAFMGLFLNQRKSGVVVLAIMVLYCLMTGASVATVRAVTMGGVLVFGKILGRKYDLLATVSWACVALLLYEPLYLFNVGFQLSFVAVFGIGILSAPVERLLAKLHLPKSNFRSSLGVGIAAVTATYPVFAFHMYEIQLYSVVGNFIIAPTTTIILVMGLVVGLLGLIWLGGAAFLAGTVYYILRFYDVFSSFFARLPNAMLLTGGGSLVVAGLGAAVLLTFAYAFNGFGEVFRKRLVIFFFAAAMLVVVVAVNRNPRALHITALDTWGSYTVIRHGREVLATGSPHGGEDVLFRYLDMHGVRRASGLFMAELPRRQDMNRLVRLAERFDYFYISGEATGTAAIIAQAVLEDVAAHMYNTGLKMPHIVFIGNGDIYIAGRKTIEISACAVGQIGLYITFGNTTISIGETPSHAHLHISDYVRTATEIFPMDGAISVRSNGRRIRLR